MEYVRATHAPRTVALDTTGEARLTGLIDGIGLGGAAATGGDGTGLAAGCGEGAGGSGPRV